MYSTKHTTAYEQNTHLNKVEIVPEEAFIFHFSAYLEDVFSVNNLISGMTISLAARTLNSEALT